MKPDRISTAIGLLILLLLAACTSQPTSVATATPSQRPPSPTPTPRPTLTPTPSLTPTPTATEILTPTVSPSPTVIFTGTPNVTWPTEPMAREYYAPIDIENGPILHYREFREVYAEAVQNNSPWLLNPVDVAFRFKGVLDETGNYPDGYYSPDLVMAFTTADDHVTVVIISENAPDDSIKDQEVRVDLVSENGIWRVEWAGYRQRCYRNNYDGWITGRCP